MIPVRAGKHDLTIVENDGTFNLLRLVLSPLFCYDDG
jgi:hypothetical protein